MSDVVLSEADLKLVEELRACRAARKELEDRESEIRKELLQTLDGAPQGLTASGSVAVKVTVQNRRNIDRPKLEALYPEVFETVVTESRVVVLNLPS